ncbi:MAG: IS3 family transposase [Cypionkella sp.]
MKYDCVYLHAWETGSQAETAIFQYINAFYNPRRGHSTL